MRIPRSHENAVTLYGPAFATDPAGAYRQIRESYGPVAPVLLEGDVPAWLVLGYREVRYVTSNPQLFARSSAKWNLWEQVPPDWPLAPIIMPNPSATFLDGPERQRRVAATNDSLDAIDRTDLTRACIRVADQVIDQFCGDGRADLLAQYAVPIPLLVMARICGIPQEESADVTRDMLLLGTATAEGAEAFGRAFGKIRELAAASRERPGRTLPHLLASHPAGLTDDEIAWELFGIVIAATGTSNWIGSALRLMLIDDQFSLALQGGRASVEAALNEVLWKDSPLQNAPGGRYATQDCDLGGWRIGKGDMIVLGLAAASADPAVRPERVDSVGANRAHLAFGHGEYACPYPAAEIAWVMARTVTEVLLDRIPDVELAVPAEDLEWRQSVWMRSLKALPVTFTPSVTVSRPGADLSG
ncbi:MAG: cytochrome P450 [Nocardiopsaceae bacterium]|nr:cytochrome P450 [Nocardiopsaceae bacterium]